MAGIGQHLDHARLPLADAAVKTHICTALADGLVNLGARVVDVAQVFSSKDDFFAKTGLYQLWFNAARKNSSRGYKSPADLLALKRLARARGSYYQGAVVFDSSNPAPAGLVFVDTSTGAAATASTPGPGDCAPRPRRTR